MSDYAEVDGWSLSPMLDPTQYSRVEEGNGRVQIAPGYTTTALGFGGMGAIALWPTQQALGWGLIALAGIVFVLGIRIDGWHLRARWLPFRPRTKIADEDKGYLAPDWPIRNLFFHIKPNISDAEFNDVAAQVIDKFSTGQLDCWGRPIVDSDRLPLVPIDYQSWQYLRLSHWLLDAGGDGMVLQADKRKQNSPVPQYTDLQVNRAQALTIWPLK